MSNVEYLAGAGEAHALYGAGSRAIKLYAGDVIELGTGERMSIIGRNRELKPGLAGERQLDGAVSIPGGPASDDVVKHAQARDRAYTASVQHVHGIRENRRIRVASDQRLGCGPLGSAVSPQQQSAIGLNVLRRQLQRMGDIVHCAFAVAHSAQGLGSQHEMMGARKRRDAAAAVNVSKGYIDLACRQRPQAGELKLLGVKIASRD